MVHTEEMNNVFFSMKKKNRKVTILSIPEQQQIQAGRRYQYDILDLYDENKQKIMDVSFNTALVIESEGIKIGETIEILFDNSPPNPPTILRINHESQSVIKT